MGNFGNYQTLGKSRNFVLRKRRSYSEIGAVLELFQVCKIGPIWPAHNANGATHIGLAQ